jgi:acyl-CoA synthetase (AMP-forming)/AMP-acid ligase II
VSTSSWTSCGTGERADPTSDPAELAARIRAALTDPGGEFEIVDRDGRASFACQRHSLRSWLDDSVALGERECVVDAGQRLTFAGHAQRVRETAAGFVEAGVRPGDRIMILAANSVDWLVAFWAGVSAGAIIVAGNAWWTSPEIDYAIEHSDPVLVVADAKRAQRIAGRETLAFDELPRGTSAPDVIPDEGEPAVIVYTSGTTGRPKGAVHSHRNLLAIVEYHRLGDAIQRELATRYGMTWSPRRFLMSLPLFHIASLHNLAIPRLASGDTVVIDQGRFDADRVLAVVERERITNWAIVPTMAGRIAATDTRRFDLSSLSALSVNSAPSSPELKGRLQAAAPGVTLADSYGLTEIGTAATVASAADLARFPTTVGTPIPTVQVEIRDAGGTAVADGVEGEIFVRGQFTMLGYWRDDDATARAITPQGWFRTGDLGRLEQGRLFMAARRGDLILRGGENVYPAEIEAVLDEHPLVLESAVHGVEHSDLGQAVAAIVVTDPSAPRPPTEAELRAWVTTRLAYYKVPERWQVTDQPLPRTATGKVVRRFT